MNPTVVLTEMGKIGWSDPVKAKEMLDKIPLGRFSGTVTQLILLPPPGVACLFVCVCVCVCLAVNTIA